MIPDIQSVFRFGSGVVATTLTAPIRHGISAERMRLAVQRCAWSTLIGPERTRGYRAAACVHQPHTDAPAYSLGQQPTSAARLSGSLTRRVNPCIDGGPREGCSARWPPLVLKQVHGIFSRRESASCPRTDKWVFCFF